MSTIPRNNSSHDQTSVSGAGNFRRKHRGKHLAGWCPGRAVRPMGSSPDTAMPSYPLNSDTSPGQHRARDRRVSVGAEQQNGRGQQDATRRCPSCGLLLLAGPHASDGACVEALRGEIESLLKRLDRKNGTPANE